MEKFLTTSEIIDMIENTRAGESTISIDSEKSQWRLGKIIYWIMVGIAVLQLAYLSLPLFMSTHTLIDTVGSQPVAVATYGQLPPSISLQIIKVGQYQFDELEVTDVVVVYNDVDSIYIEKQVISIDQANQTFVATYTGTTADTYEAHDLIGVNEGTAGIFQLFLFAVSTQTGYIGTAVVYVLIFGISYVFFFKRDKILIKDSDEDER